MKKLIILITFFFLAINIAVAEKTAKDLLNPSNNAYDFTFSSDINEDLNSYSTSQVVDKVEMDVEKIQGFIPRTNVIFECQEDTYGSTYCPEALAPASDYLAYSESQVVEHKKTITDYEQGTYQELTSTVRDFMDGYAIENTDTVTDSQTGTGTKNVGTVIDYQSNSTASKHTGSVIDVAEKEGASNAIEPVINDITLSFSRSRILFGTNQKLRSSGDKLEFNYYNDKGDGGYRNNGTITINGGCTINSTTIGIFKRQDQLGVSNGGKTISFYYYDDRGDGGYKLSGQLKLNGCYVKAYRKTFANWNSVNGFTYNNHDSTEINSSTNFNEILFGNYNSGEGEGRYSVNNKLVFYGEETCPSGYIMNSDSTKCLKLEPTITEVEDSGWVYDMQRDGVFIRRAKYGAYYNSYSGTNIEAYWNGSLIKDVYTGRSAINYSFNHGGYRYTLGQPRETWEVGNGETTYRGLQPIRRTRNIEKCNQYGEMVNVGGTNYCTYEYTYEEPNQVLDSRVEGITSEGIGYDYGNSKAHHWNAKSRCYNKGAGWRLPYVSEYGTAINKIPTYNGWNHTLNSVRGNWGWIKKGDSSKSVDLTPWYQYGTIHYRCLTVAPYVSSCNEGGELVTIDGKEMCRYAGEMKKCPDGYTENASGTCEKTVNYDMYSYSCPANYTPINNGFTSYQKTDPDPTLPNWNTLDDAVNSATAPAQNCKRTITYEYYNYNCPNGYTVANPGLTMCEKTDPNKSTNDSATLSQACNSSTPPQGNCTKEVAYNYYEYACSNGYTPIDAGLTECTKTDTNTSGDSTSTLDDACNSATPPSENCYKDISYKHYTYGCSEGYITDNYGLATCPKTDPNRSANNSELLDDACNSATPPEGNCRKDISYSYYEYLCEGQNSFYESYTVLDGGLSECEKTDSDINSVNSDLSTACNSSTAPKGNCESTEYTCNSNVFNPVFVDNKWQCSTYFCNDENKCGYGMCESYVSQDSYMPSSLNILSTVVNSDPVNCNQSYEYDDGISQKHIIKYCENGYIENATCLEKDTSNNCIKFETSDTEAKCIQDNNTCTDGYEKINGVCTAEPTKEYYYHTYTCKNETNEFNENWELINKVTDPGCIDDTFGSCINFDESTSNCRRLTRSCSNGGECNLDTSVNQWKCTNDYAYIKNTSCNGPLCDLVLNDKITYCVNEECPTANGVYEVDGDCKIKLCPDGTFESDGLCYTE